MIPGQKVTLRDETGNTRQTGYIQSVETVCPESSSSHDFTSYHIKCYHGFDHNEMHDAAAFALKLAEEQKRESEDRETRRLEAIRVLRDHYIDYHGYLDIAMENTLRIIETGASASTMRWVGENRFADSCNRVCYLDRMVMRGRNGDEEWAEFALCSAFHVINGLIQQRKLVNGNTVCLHWIDWHGEHVQHSFVLGECPFYIEIDDIVVVPGVVLSRKELGDALASRVTGRRRLKVRGGEPE